jgi:gliding motility-associated-like protein
MKKNLVLLFLFLNVLAFSQPKNVLFIGNSYTYSNNMPQIVSDLAGSAGDNLIYDESTISNYSLYEHSTNSATLGLISQGGWDYVVLQEFSQWPSQPLMWVEENVYPYAQYLDGEINSHNPEAETIFYMTWGRRDGDDSRCSSLPEVCTYTGMDDLTRERYMIMAEANHAIVSPVGAVWRYIRENYPSIELYIPDGSHPNQAGSYLAACCFYTAIFRKDPSLLTYDYTLSPADAGIIRNAAKLIIFDNLLTWHIGEYDPDTQAPTVPSGLIATNITETGFHLAWNASSDNKGVTGYDIFKDGLLLTTVSGTSANITGLTASNTYSMTIRAKDAAGNSSGPCNVLEVTTFTRILLTISGVTINNKVYDGTTAASLNTGGAILVGVLSGDAVMLISTGASGIFINKNTGLAKPVSTSGFTLGGPDAYKYELVQPAGSANISKANLLVTGVGVNNKIYDGTTSASLNTASASLSGVFSGDAVSINSSGATGTFVNRNAGTAKPVSVSGFTIGGNDAGNYTLIQPSLTANITTATLTVNGITANNKIYDATKTAILNIGGAVLTGILGSDAVNLISTSVTGSFDSKNAGTSKYVSASGFSLGGPDMANYSLSQPVTTANIMKASLTVSGVSANNKVYNGTTVATLNTGSALLAGVLGGDNVTIVSAGATGTFVNRNVGANKIVTASGLTLSGSDSGNYTIIVPALSADITKAPLTISGLTANNKVYDGTTAATLNLSSASLTGIIDADAVSLNSSAASGTFSDANIGSGKVVTTTGFTLGGTDSGNYSLTQPSVTASITGILLTISGVSINNKVYDGTTTAILNTAGASLTGVLSGDIVTLITSGATGNYADRNAGTGKTVTTTGFSLGGADAGKYTLTSPTVAGNILRANLTLSGVSAANKIYNGTTGATLNTGTTSLSGIVGSDNVNLVTTGASGAFADRFVGTNKPVTTSGFTLSGTHAGNYTLIQPLTTASIAHAILTISGVTANNKIYDGTRLATLNIGNAALTGVISGDNVTLISSGVTGSFDNEYVGNGKVVSISGFSAGGTDSGNYILTQPTAIASITGIKLTVSGVTANNKVYNATTVATLNTASASLTGVLAGDNVSLVTSGAAGTFANRNVGTARTVTTTGFTLGGSDAGKYILTQPSTTADITAATITVSGVTVNNKVYDGTTYATINGNNASLHGVLGGDAVSALFTGVYGTFENKNAGSAKQVTISGIIPAGPDAINYTLTQPAATADISRAVLTVSGVTANNKVYNGTRYASLNMGSASLVGILGTDAVTLVETGASGIFANKNAGSSKTVTISGFTIAGSDSGNYSLIQPSASASISPIGLHVTGITANNKVYNGTTATTLNTHGVNISGILSGDEVNLVSTGATGTFNNKNVGSHKIVVTSGFSLIGSDAVNYSVILPATEADITPAVLTISGLRAINKVYDGHTKATLNTSAIFLSGVFGSDLIAIISTNAEGSFSGKNAGTRKSVSTSGFTLTGTDSPNYTLTQPSLTADIIPKPVTITANDITKHYKTKLTFTGTEFTAEGLIPNDIQPAFTFSSPGASETAAVGKYNISVSGGADQNYIFTYVKGILTVGKTILRVTADNLTKVYGSEIPQLSISFSGFVKDEDSSVLDELPVVSTTAQYDSKPGMYIISLTGGGDNNYDFTLVDGSLEVLKAPLVITADNKTKIYREAIPELTMNYSGFVLGQDQSVLDVLPVTETGADTDSDAGNYDIIVSGAADSNYTFIYKKGTLIIDRADQVISFARLPGKLRMTSEQTLNATATSGLEVNFEVSDTDIAGLINNKLKIYKDGQLIIKASQPGDNNWNQATDVSQSITALPTFDDISSLFTPNNDGINDYWYIPDLVKYGNVEVMVYNRFGQKVYHSDSYKNDWDGTWNGYPLPSASYYYIIKSSKKGYIKSVVNIVR